MWRKSLVLTTSTTGSIKLLYNYTHADDLMPHVTNCNSYGGINTYWRIITAIWLTITPAQSSHFGGLINMTLTYKEMIACPYKAYICTVWRHERERPYHHNRKRGNHIALFEVMTTTHMLSSEYIGSTIILETLPMWRKAINIHSFNIKRMPACRGQGYQHFYSATQTYNLL